MNTIKRGPGRPRKIQIETPVVKQAKKPRDGAGPLPLKGSQTDILLRKLVASYLNERVIGLNEF